VKETEASTGGSRRGKLRKKELKFSRQVTVSRPLFNSAPSSSLQNKYIFLKKKKKTVQEKEEAFKNRYWLCFATGFILMPF